MEDSLRERTLSHLWRFETRLPMYGLKPYLSNWMPSTSTKRALRSPSWSLPHQRHPTAQGAMSQHGMATVVTPGRWPISRGLATGPRGGSACASCAAATPSAHAASLPSDGLAGKNLGHGGP